MVLWDYRHWHSVPTQMSPTNEIGQKPQLFPKSLKLNVNGLNRNYVPTQIKSDQKETGLVLD